MGIKDYLPDFKGALNSFYDERLKAVIDNKSMEYKELVAEFVTQSLNYQKALLTVGVGIFLLLALAYFWTD